MKTTLKKGSLLVLGACIFLGSMVNAAAVVPSAATAPSANPGSEAPMPTVKEMMNSFKNLSRKEKKARFKEVRKELKEYRKQKKSGAEPMADQTLLIILAILIPPLGVYLHQGEINSKFWISLLLTLLFWLPGAIYSVLVVLGEIE